jgi:hypothetical protein
MRDTSHEPVLERYRIAQIFHELTADGADRSVAATLLSARHGIRTEDVLEFAAEFDKEPLWRL